MSDDLELPKEIKNIMYNNNHTQLAIEEATKRGIEGKDVKLFCLIYAYLDDFADCVIQDCEVVGNSTADAYYGNSSVEYQVSKREHSHRVADLSAELLLKLKELMTI
jgi:hypothetical protein